MYPFEIAVNQILPWPSATKPCGPDPGVFGRKLFECAGSRIQSAQFVCCLSGNQSDPSGATAGSCGRDLGVGTSNSLIDTCFEAADRTITARQIPPGTMTDLRK